MNYVIDCIYSRFLQLPSIPLTENAIELLDHSVTFYSDDYIRALNGEIEDGQLNCNLSTSEPFMANRTYSLPDDIVSCSQVCHLIYVTRPAKINHVSTKNWRFFRLYSIISNKLFVLTQ